MPDSGPGQDFGNFGKDGRGDEQFKLSPVEQLFALARRADWIDEGLQEDIAIKSLYK